MFHPHYFPFLPSPKQEIAITQIPEACVMRPVLYTIVCRPTRVSICAETHADIHTQVQKGYGKESLAAILGGQERKSKRRKQEKARNREQTGCGTFIRVHELKTYQSFFFHICWTAHSVSDSARVLYKWRSGCSGLDLTREEFYCRARANGKIPGRGLINNWTNDSSYQYWRAEKDRGSSGREAEETLRDKDGVEGQKSISAMQRHSQEYRHKSLDGRFLD